MRPGHVVEPGHSTSGSSCSRDRPISLCWRGSGNKRSTRPSTTTTEHAPCVEGRPAAARTCPGKTGRVAITFRRATAVDSDMLSDLALRSKAYWGYEPRFLAACRAELTVHAGDIELSRVT